MAVNASIPAPVTSIGLMFIAALIRRCSLPFIKEGLQHNRLELKARTIVPHPPNIAGFAKIPRRFFQKRNARVTDKGGDSRFTTEGDEESLVGKIVLEELYC